jgi:hypothetical protein
LSHEYLAWHVTNKGEKSFWNRVGVVWAHKDGKGYTLQLETCPINGRIVLCGFRRSPNCQGALPGAPLVLFIC